MTTHFITFGTSDWADAATRVGSEATATGLFDAVRVFREIDLHDWPLRAAARGTRGFGFWGWKPWLALRVLDEIKDDDLLIYSDAGNTITNSHRWSTYFEMARARSFVGFFTQYIEQQYTKADLLCELPGQWLTPQIWAGAWILKKCAATIDLMHDWRRVFMNPSLVDDSPSELPNAPGFIEHRHDQSALSILVKRDMDPRGWLSHEQENFGADRAIQCTRKR